MAVDRRQGIKVPKWVKQEETPGARIDSGPYVAIVKNNIDPARAGRLQVWIPDLGGDPNVPENWRTVNYASPFIGQTFIAPDNESAEKFEDVPHSYGFWMVPPDVGVQVLVTFVAGDPLRGYWFACLTPEYSHTMIPAMATSTVIDTDVIDPSIASSAEGSPSGNGYPTAEFNFYKWDANSVDNLDVYTTFRRPIHTIQYKILLEQGILKDPVRGAHTSSSQRESPSTVFGVSTPGRPLRDGEGNPSTNGEVKGEDYAVKGRRGGHVFVMDDGDHSDNNRLVKLRTSSGHQILLNDSNDVIYIINAKGNSWIELTGDGQINVFSDSGFNFRTRGTINMHADLDININAGRKLNIAAGSDAQLDAASIKFKTGGSFLASGNKIAMHSESALNLTAGGVGSFGAGSQLIFSGSCIGLNSASAPEAEKPKQLAKNTLNETEKQGAVWTINPGKLKSIVTIAPTHEPFERASGRTTNIDMTTGRFPPGNTSDTVAPHTPTDATLLEIIVEFLKKEEGFPRGGKAYLDPPNNSQGLYSIGYGHQIKSNEFSSGINCGPAGVVSVKSPVTETVMSREQAEELLKIDLTKSGGYIDSAKGPIGGSWSELSKYQQAALVSYAYNTGSTSSLVRAGIVKLLNRDQLAAAGELISTKGIATAGGQPFPPLVRRRRAETALWNTA